MSIKNNRLNVNRKLLYKYLPDKCWETEKTMAVNLGITVWQLRQAKQSLIDSGKLKLELAPNGKRMNPIHILHKVKSKTNPIKKDSFCESRSEARLVALGLWMDVERLDLISFYFKSGFFLCPVKPGEKKPRFSQEYIRRCMNSEDKLLDWMDEHPTDGIGHWNYSFFVVDVDTPTEDIHSHYDTLTARTKRGTHQYFLPFAAQRALNGKLAVGVDTKCNGAFVMLPPTANYSWEVLISPIETPAAIQNFFGNRRTSDTGNNRSNNLMKLEQAYPDKIYYSGERHDELFRRGRSLRFSMDMSELSAELHRVNRELFNPPLPKEEVDKMVGKIIRQENRPGFTRN